MNKHNSPYSLFLFCQKNNPLVREKLNTLCQLVSDYVFTGIIIPNSLRHFFKIVVIAPKFGGLIPTSTISFLQ